MPIHVITGKTGYVPTRDSEYAAGLDLRSPADYELPARGKIIINLDIKIKPPNGTYGRIASKSSLSSKYSIEVGAGVIDWDYRGDLHVVLYNHSDKDFKIERGRKIAQIIFTPVTYDKIIMCDNLEETVRNESGFGSTGCY